MGKILEDTREEFLRKNSIFFENGLLQELYHNNHISVINLANSGYVATDYSLDKVGKTIMVFIDKRNVRSVAYDAKRYYEILNHYFKNGIAQKNVFSLDENAFRVISELKRKTDKDGPSEYVDKDIDSELLEKSEKEYGGRSI